MRVEPVVVLVCASFILLGLYLFLRLITAWGRRRAIERVVIGQISTVVRQNMPLATALSLAAESEREAARTNLKQISSLLGRGLDLSRAVQLGFPNCSAIVVSLIAAGQQAGQLPLALEQAEQYLMERDRQKERFNPVVWPYFVIVLITLTLVLTGIMIFVIPKFRVIFQDFSTQLPGVTRLMLGFAEACAGILWLVFVALMVGIPVGTYLSLRPRRLPNPSVVSRAADWLRWYCPVLRWMDFGKGMSILLQTLRICLRAGMSLHTAARVAATIDVNSRLRRRMSRFADLLVGGTNVREASLQAGLGKLVSMVLAGGQQSHDMDSALRYAADYYQAVFGRKWIVLRNMAWPVSVMIMASLVGTVVVALFMPLVTLVNSVS
ncbi:MAG: type II secretion system F family protein [Planctomycetota bacterium]|jgi:type II secretory pathway component PulF